MQGLKKPAVLVTFQSTDLADFQRQAEIDNTNKIISLIQGRERQMLDHLLDGKRLFVTHNH